MLKALITKAAGGNIGVKGLLMEMLVKDEILFLLASTTLIHTKSDPQFIWMAFKDLCGERRELFYEVLNHWAHWSYDPSNIPPGIEAGMALNLLFESRPQVSLQKFLKDIPGIPQLN